MNSRFLIAALLCEETRLFLCVPVLYYWSVLSIKQHCSLLLDQIQYCLVYPDEDYFNTSGKQTGYASGVVVGVPVSATVLVAVGVLDGLGVTVGVAVVGVGVGVSVTSAKRRCPYSSELLVVSCPSQISLSS